MGQIKMNNLRLGTATRTTISWRDELEYSHGAKSEGFEKLKEAIRLAKSSVSVSDSIVRKGTSVARVKSAAAGD
jgi:hypothetical protein